MSTAKNKQFINLWVKNVTYMMAKHNNGFMWQRAEAEMIKWNLQEILKKNKDQNKMTY